MSGLPRTLEPNLLVGYDSSDDAAVYRLTDELALIQTVDFFPPVVDDPYDFGQIAAANALSDVYAMGGEPRLAMNLLAVPSCLPREAVGAILEGGAAKVAEAGAVTAGGHSIEDTEPKYGLCVSGLVHPGAVLTNRGAREGDLLVLTKPLGTGILTTAAKAELLSGAEYRAMTDLMAALNRDAARAAVPLRPSACTDVTGFGLIGHAREMAEGAGCTIELWPGRVPIVPQALELARDGIIPAGAYRNLEFAGPEVETAGTFPQAVLDCLYDPQTSGGLLLAIAEERGAELLRRLADAGADYVSFHTDATRFVRRTINEIRAAGMKPGILINPSQRIDHIEPFIKYVDMITLMTVEPGFAGQPFLEGGMERLQEIADLRRKHGCEFLINVDGGIDYEKGRRCKEIGVDVIVGTVHNIFRQPEGLTEACRRFNRELG